MRPLLEIIDLKVYYHQRGAVVRAIDGITIKVFSGEILGITGESGCGKTTLARTILRILPSNAEVISGKILFHGKNLLELPEEEMRKIRQKSISIILQGTHETLNPLMLSGIQVAEAIEYHLEKDISEALEMTEKIFKDVELGRSHIITLPNELSTGMVQRVKIALALSTRPELVIADEPFVGLHTILQASLIDLLIRLKKKYDVTLLYFSHNLARMIEIADRITVMYGGKIVEIAPAKNIFKTPIHPYTKGLIGAIPLPRMIRKQKKYGLIWIPGNPPDPSNPPNGCRFHPRCPIAKEICRKTEPSPLLINETIVYCHFAKDLVDISPYDFWSKHLS